MFEQQTAGVLPMLSKMSWKMKAKSNVAARPAVTGEPDAPGSRIRLPVDKFVAPHISGEVIQTTYGKLGVIKIYDYNTFFFVRFLTSFLKLVMAMRDHAAVIDVRGEQRRDRLPRADEHPVLHAQHGEAGALLDAHHADHGAAGERAAEGERDEGPAVVVVHGEHEVRAARRRPVLGRFSLISEQLFRDYKGGRYNREMYVLTDAETYSSGDVFAASCQDNAAAFLIGTDETTGAGGSSSVFYSEYLHDNCPEEFPKLPGDVDFALSHRRMNRVGPYSGIAIESFGVTPDKRYYPTYRDRVYKDRDLYEFLGKFISARYNASVARTAGPTPTPAPARNRTNPVPQPTVKPALVSPQP